MIVPVLFGSGVKIKILEALAYGVPIVTTSIGSSGVSIQHGVNGYIEDDLSNFHCWMTRLHDQRTNELISRNASALYDEVFSKEAVYKSYDKLFDLSRNSIAEKEK